MASAPAAGVLEKKESRRYFDDTVPLTASITTHKVFSSHAEYVIRVQRGPNPADSWEVSHRYSEFANLHQTLQVARVPLPLPPKTLFKNKERQFLQERQTKLQEFLDIILSEPLLSSHVSTKRFLDPTNYDENFRENALRNVSMFFRSEPEWSVVEPLHGMGWRLRKQYYLIASKTDPKLPKHLLSWCEPGPDFSLGEREMEAALKVLTDIRHPYILSPVSARYNGTGVMVVRRFVPSGSLRDAIYGVQPQAQVLQKYVVASAKPSIDVHKIRLCGKQVLEALNLLKEKGFVIGHIHAGNVILEGGTCKLVDLENTLIGVPSMYRQHLVEIRKIHTQVGEAVYSFGHMLYEMCTGSQLKSATLDSIPPSIPQSVAPILESILTPKGIKNGIPSLSDLLANPFFSEVPGWSGEKPSIRVPSKLKEVLKVHIDQIEQHLHEQQRRLTQLNRESKARESLMSEDEKKKRRKLRKKQLSLQDTGEPTAYPTTTSLPRQHTIDTSQPHTRAAKSTSPRGSSSQALQENSSTSNNTSKSKTKASSASKVPPPPAVPAAPPEPRQPPPKSGERGALLSSIEGFTKGKLKKAVTNDRSAPKV